MNTEGTQSGKSSETDGSIDPQDLARRIQLGEFVRRELKSRGWTQEMAAKQVGCDQTNISKIIKGKQRTSEDMVRRLLAAFELPDNHLDQLPSPEFEPGSIGFRLKSLIIGAHVEHALPEEDEGCARHHITQLWVNDEYRELSRTPNMEDAVWAALVAEGYFTIEEGIYKTNYGFQGHLRYFMSSYVSHVCSSIEKLSWIEAQQSAGIIAQLASTLDKLEASLANPQRIIDCIDLFNRTLANNDVLIASIFGGYTNGFRLYMQTASSLASTTEEYDESVRPLMSALFQVLKKALTDLQKTGKDYDWHQSVQANMKTIDAAVAEWIETLKPVESSLS